MLTADGALAILPAMPGRWRQRTALSIVGVAVFPWLSAAAVLLHLEHDAHHDARDSESGFAAAVHGHDHERGTPYHEHLLTLPGATLSTSRASLASLAAALAPVVSVAVATGLRFAAGAVSLGHDPPSARRSVSVLRI